MKRIGIIVVAMLLAGVGLLAPGAAAASAAGAPASPGRPEAAGASFAAPASPGLLGLPDSPPSESQRARWDDALDRYARICNTLLSLKARVAAGEDVDASEAGSVVAELSELKILLSHGNGEMTASQKERFERIQKCFEEGRIVTDKAMGEIAAGEGSKAEVGPAAEPGSGAGGDDVEAVADSKNVRRGFDRSLNRVYVLGVVGYPPFGYGLMAIERYGRFGGYLKVRGTMDSPSYSYTATADGKATFDYGVSGYFWGKYGSGTRTSNMSFTCGFDYSPCAWVDVYTGLGYGWSRKYWTDDRDRLVLVSDLSVSGVAAEVGAVFNWKLLSIALGVETVAFKTCTPYLGLGINF